MNSTAFKKKVTSNVKDPNTECEDNETQMNRQKPSGEHTRTLTDTHTHVCTQTEGLLQVMHFTAVPRVLFQ